MSSLICFVTRAGQEAMDAYNKQLYLRQFATPKTPNAHKSTRFEMPTLQQAACSDVDIHDICPSVCLNWLNPVCWVRSVLSTPRRKKAWSTFRST